MPFQKLTAADLSASTDGASRSRSPYTLFMGGLRVGEGGRTTVAEEGISRAQIKNRLKASAKDVGVKIAFLRTEPEEVVFKVVARASIAAGKD